MTRVLPLLGVLAEWLGRVAGGVRRVPVAEVTGAGFVVAGIRGFSESASLIAVGVFLLLAARQASEE